jgi:hypothetical protein
MKRATLISFFGLVLVRFIALPAFAQDAGHRQELDPKTSGRCWPLTSKRPAAMY